MKGKAMKTENTIENSQTKQIMLELRLRRTPESITAELNEKAKKGFCYGGGIYVIKAKGVYTFRAMV